MKMTIKPNNCDDIKWQEIRKELNYLSKNWDISFIKYIEGWTIEGTPKNSQEGETLKEGGEE